MPIPTTTNFSPEVVKPGDLVTLRGKNFQFVTQIHLVGESGESKLTKPREFFSIISNTEINFRMPLLQGSDNQAKIKVFNRLGSSEFEKSIQLDVEDYYKPLPEPFKAPLRAESSLPALPPAPTFFVRPNGLLRVIVPVVENADFLRLYAVNENGTSYCIAKKATANQTLLVFQDADARPYFTAHNSSGKVTGPLGPNLSAATASSESAPVISVSGVTGTPPKAAPQEITSSSAEFLVPSLPVNSTSLRLEYRIGGLGVNDTSGWISGPEADSAGTVLVLTGLNATSTYGVRWSCGPNYTKRSPHNSFVTEENVIQGIPVVVPSGAEGVLYTLQVREGGNESENWTDMHRGAVPGSTIFFNLPNPAGYYFTQWVVETLDFESQPLSANALTINGSPITLSGSAVNL